MRLLSCFAGSGGHRSGLCTWFHHFPWFLCVACRQAFAAPVVSWLTENNGWRTWSVIAAIFNAAAAVVAATLLRNSPEAIPSAL
eukprot:5544154-Amphidinium_carterae.1